MAHGKPANSSSSGLISGLPRNLALRILSSLVILPPAAAFLVMGGWCFAGLVASVAGCIAWEWTRIVSQNDNRMVAGLAAAGCATVVGSSALALPAVVPYLAVAALAVVMVATFVRGELRRYWIIAGCVVACVPCLAILWLRVGEPLGLALVAWLISAVVATDVGAYIAGKTIGGARLAPRISPNKTWAGLLGGMLASAGAGWGGGIVITDADPIVLSGLGALVAITAQIGDLLESLFKRKFGVKESGGLIPGHGGVLDRLDGHLMVILVTSIVVLVSGQTPLLW
jgi:phosphatidate cytidylyltransferase